MRICLALTALALALAAGPSTAHDFWIQPERFMASPSETVSFVLLAGHGSERQRSRLTRPRVARFIDVAPSGKSTDLTPRLTLGGPSDGAARIVGTGVHVLVLATDNRNQSHQPAGRYNTYLHDEGLTAAISARRRAGLSEADGSERYSRAAKALIQAGDLGEGPQQGATRPVGLKLEIVPQISPYALPRPAKLPVQVLYRGQPLTGALVKLTDLDHDAEPAETHRTDASGRAAFTLPVRGRWMLNVVWSTPAPRDWDTDFETVFSSLSFGFPAIAKESDSAQGAAESRSVHHGTNGAAP